MEDSSEKADVDWLALDDSEYGDLCLDVSDDDLNPLVMDVGPSSPILGKPSGRFSKVIKESQGSTSLLSPVTSEASVINATQNNTGAEGKTDSERNVKMIDVRDVELPKKQNLSLKRPGVAIVSLQEKKSNSESLPSGNRTSCFQNEKSLLVGSPAVNESVCDDDAISLYAKDEDCSSLYQSRLPHVQTCRKPFRGGRGRNIVARKGFDLRSRVRRPKPDLRNTIRMADNYNEPGADTLLSECNRMLNTNSYENVVIAAERFCKAYTQHVFQQGGQEVGKFLRRLSSMLFRHKELKYLYRVVRLSITMNIHLDEDVICDFVESLCGSKEYGKVNIVLTQMRDASLVYGDRARNLLTKYVDTPARNRGLPNRNSRIVTEANDSLHPGSFINTSHLHNEQKNAKKNGILDGVSLGPTGLNWKKSQLFVEIPDIHNAKKHRITHLAQETGSHNTMHATVSMRNGMVKGDENGEVDYVKLGSCVTEMLEAVGGLRVTPSLFSAFAELIVSTGMHNSLCSNFRSLGYLDSFVIAAIDSANDKERIKSHLSWICVEVRRLLAPDLSYQVARYSHRVGLKLVPPVSTSGNTQSSRKSRFFCADSVVNNCLEHNDLNLALAAVDQYFAEAEVDFGPFLSPLICKMLCKVAEVAYAEKRHMDAAKCCTLLPAGFGDGTEAALMEDILVEILTNPESLTLAVNEQICNGMVDQMLTRGMSTEVRKIIVKAFSANVVPVFKFLERKGVYQKPQIARCPHLIVIPYVLCVEEMAMVIQRHLTELSEFLVEMGERVRMDIPMRIVLSKSVGPLKLFSLAKSPLHSYKNSLTHLMETLSKVVTPSLNHQSKAFLPATREFQINVDITSVRSWMLENTNYHEGSVLKQA